MAALSRLRILYNELLAVQAHQVVPWVVPWAAPTVWAACVGHGCGGPPVVREYQVGEPSPLELVGFLCWQGFAHLELAAAPLEVGGHPTCTFFMLGGCQLFRGGIYVPVGECVFNRLKSTDLVTRSRVWGTLESHRQLL